MPGAMISGPWTEGRMIALRNTFMRVLEGRMAASDVSAEMQTSIEYLRPMWDAIRPSEYLYASEARNHLVDIFVGPYKFPNTRALYAALKDLDVSIEAFKDASPDGLSTSVQMLLEAGYWGEADSLMEKRCQTKESKKHGLDKYFLRREDTDDWGV